MKKTYLLLSVISLILFIAGFYTYTLFLDWVVPEHENLQIVVTSLSGGFKQRLYYSVFMGLIPIAIYFTWKLCRIGNIKTKVTITITILLSTILALLLRIAMTNKIADFVIDERIVNTITIENLKYTQFMFAGLLTGCFISWIIFRQKTVKEKLPAAHE